MKVITKAILDSETLNWIYIESYDYEGALELCCGPGHEMTQQDNQEENLSTQLANDYNTRFAGQTQTLGQLNTLLTNVQNGKLLPGFNAQTQAALNSQAINSATGNARNVTQALNNANAGRGGDSGLEPGFVGAEKATALTGVANQEAAQLQKNTLANQQQAEQNTAMALGGYNQLASQENPEAFGQLSNQAENQAFNQANTISNMYNQGEAQLAGGITSLAMDAAGGIGGAMGGGGAKGFFQGLSG